MSPEKSKADNTYEDYLKYPEGERIEIIDGKIYNMAPAPSRQHQSLCFQVAFALEEYIRNKKQDCHVYISQFDVRFVDEESDTISNVVQPDVSVICEKAKLDDKGCIGSPDFIAEVVSPSNSNIDYIKKLWLYEKYGVREYWIINPMRESILVYRINENGFYPEAEAYSFADNIKVGIFSDLYIKIQTVRFCTLIVYMVLVPKTFFNVFPYFNLFSLEAEIIFFKL